MNSFVILDNQDAVILHLLPCVISADRILKRKSTNKSSPAVPENSAHANETSRKNSHGSQTLQDRRDSFFIHVQVST